MRSTKHFVILLTFIVINTIHANEISTDDIPSQLTKDIKLEKLQLTNELRPDVGIQTLEAKLEPGTLELLERPQVDPIQLTKDFRPAVGIQTLEAKLDPGTLELLTRPQVDPIQLTKEFIPAGGAQTLEGKLQAGTFDLPRPQVDPIQLTKEFRPAGGAQTLEGKLQAGTFDLPRPQVDPIQLTKEFRPVGAQTLEAKLKPGTFDIQYDPKHIQLTKDFRPTGTFDLPSRPQVDPIQLTKEFRLPADLLESLQRPQVDPIQITREFRPAGGIQTLETRFDPGSFNFGHLTKDIKPQLTKEFRPAATFDFIEEPEVNVPKIKLTKDIPKIRTWRYSPETDFVSSYKKRILGGDAFDITSVYDKIYSQDVSNNDKFTDKYNIKSYFDELLKTRQVVDDKFDINIVTSPNVVPQTNDYTSQTHGVSINKSPQTTFLSNVVDILNANEYNQRYSTSNLSPQNWYISQVVPLKKNNQNFPELKDEIVGDDKEHNLYVPILRLPHKNAESTDPIRTIVIQPYPFYPKNANNLRKFLTLTNAEYIQQFLKIKYTLSLLGFDNLPDSKYDAIIASGGFIYNDHVYLYKDEYGKYEKTRRYELTEVERFNILKNIRLQIISLGFDTLSDAQIKRIFATGIFKFGGIKWDYNYNTGKFENIEITQDEYTIIVKRIRNFLDYLGYDDYVLSEKEINRTISTGILFIGRNKYNFDYQLGRFDKVTLTDNEYKIILNILTNELRTLGLTPMTDAEIIQTIKTGILLRDNIRWIYNPRTGLFQRDHIEDDSIYRSILKRLLKQIRLAGYFDISEIELLNAIRTGVLLHGTNKWLYDFQTGELIKLQISIDEYRNTLNNIKEQLQKLGYNHITESEFNRTITTGIFYHGSDKWVYDYLKGIFEKVKLAEDKHRTVLEWLANEINILGFDRLTEKDFEKALNTGCIIRGGIKWYYNAETGRYEKTSLTATDYKLLVETIRDKLAKLGYININEKTYNQTIITGVFLYGGNKWHYNYNTDEFERIELTEDEHKAVIDKLRKDLKRLGFDDIKEREIKESWKSGVVIRNGIKWVYDASIGRYEQEELTDQDFKNIFTNLKEELAEIGYTHLTDETYNETLSSGVFIFGGDKWQFNYDVRDFKKIDFPESEHREVLKTFDIELKYLGFNPLSIDEINAALEEQFVIRGGIKWCYDAKTGRYEPNDITPEEYEDILENLKVAVNNLGYTHVTLKQYNHTIHTGVFIREGTKWQYNYITGTLDKVPLTDTEYLTILDLLRVELARIGYKDVTDKEFNETITTNIFIRASNKYEFDYDTQKFEKIELSEEKRKVILASLQEELKFLNLKLLTENDIEKLTHTGFIFIGNTKIVYDARLEQYVIAHLTDDDYRTILVTLKDELKRLGYLDISDAEYNTTIEFGSFIRGDVKWTFDAHTGQLERTSLNEEEYKLAIQKIRYDLETLGFKHLTEDEYNQTLKTSIFVRGSTKYEYNYITQKYEEVILTEEQHRKVLHGLEDELIRLGNKPLTDDERNGALLSGVIIRGVVKWYYDARLGRYELADLSHSEIDELLTKIKLALNALEYNLVSENEYNDVLRNGVFIRGGNKYEYNYITGTFIKVTFTNDDYRSVLSKLREKLRGIGFRQITEEEYNETITTNYFIRGPKKYKFDYLNDKFYEVILSPEKHRDYLLQLEKELISQGFDALTPKEIESSLKTYVYIRGLNKWSYDARLERYIEAEITSDEYKKIKQQMKKALTSIGVWDLRDERYNKTIRTGQFSHDGINYKFNYADAKFVQTGLSDEAYRNIVEDLRETLVDLGYRLMSEKEYNDTINNGYFYRGGIKWEYDVDSGNHRQSGEASRIDEISDEDYEILKDKLQKTLVQIGYDKLSDNECEEVITKGLFIRGGNTWIYNPDSGEFEEQEIPEDDLNDRLEILSEEFGGDKSNDELTDIIKTGYYQIEHHRFEYNPETGKFEKLN